MRIHKEELLKPFLERNDKKNILIVSDAYYPFVGGAAVVVDSLASELSKNHNVAVITTYAKGYEDKANYPVIRCGGINFGKKIGILGLPNWDNKLKKLVNSMQIDVMHIHSYFAIAKFCLKIAKKRNIPVVVHGHSRFYEEFYHISKSKFIANTLTKSAMKLLNQADIVLPVSKSVEKRYEELGLTVKSQVVKNATELRFLQDENFVSEIEKKYSLDKNTTRLCYFSRITKIKNVDIIADTSKALMDKNFNFKMYIVGDGEDEEYFKNKINQLNLSQNVIFLGKITDKIEKSAIMQNMDLFVFPSIVDTSCLVKYEFASQKVPTLCVKNSAVSEDVVDCENGYTADAIGEDFANKIISIFENKKQKDTVNQNAYKTLGKSWADVCVELDEIYNNLMK